MKYKQSNFNKPNKTERPNNIPEVAIPAYLHPTSREYLIGRGLNKEDIEFYDLSFCDSGEWKNRVIIPIYNDDGVLLAYQGRSIDDKEPRYRTEGSRPIYRTWEEQTTDFIVVVEGPFDMYSVLRAYPYVVACLGVYPSQNQIQELIRLAKTTMAPEIVLWFDVGATREVYELQLVLQPYVYTTVLVDLDHKDPGSIGRPEDVKSILSEHIES